MLSSKSNNPEPSEAVRALIQRIFPSDEQPIACELVRSFHWESAPAVDERIHLDMLEISEGSLEKLRTLLELANRDWRDLIMTAEYNHIDGKIVQNERAQRRLTELAQRKQEPNSGSLK
jgi:hypothetical protein